MPVLLSGLNLIDILQPNGVTEDLTLDRSELHVGLIVSDDTVQLQVSPSPIAIRLHCIHPCGVRSFTRVSFASYHQPINLSIHQCIDRDVQYQCINQSMDGWVDA